MSHNDFDFEPIPGLPERPPSGESIIWQGSPRWTTLALRAFHVRKVAIYFFIAWLWLALRAAADMSALQALATSSWVLIPATIAIGLLAGVAWLHARMTIYTITSKRVVIRSGVALPTSVNLPFSIIESAALKPFADGSGDVALSLESGQRASYTVLWPNVRPGYFTNPAPALRCIANAEEVAGMLANALEAESAAHPMPRVKRESQEENFGASAQPSHG